MSIVDSVRNIISARDVIRERLGYMGLLPDAGLLKLGFEYSGTTENASGTELYEYISVARTNTNITINYDYAELGSAEDDFIVTISRFGTNSIVITPKKIHDRVQIWIVNPDDYMSDDDTLDDYHGVYFFYGSDFKKKPNITFNFPSYPYKLWIRNLNAAISQLGSVGYGSILSLDIMAGSQRQLSHCVTAMLNMNIQNILDKTLVAGSSYTFQPGYYREGGTITAVPNGDISDLEQEYYNRLYVNFDSPGNPDGGAIKLINDLRGENYDLYNRMYVDWDPEESGDDGGAAQVIANVTADYLAEFELRKKYHRFLYVTFDQGDYDTFVDPYLNNDELEKIPGVYGELARRQALVEGYEYLLYQDYDSEESGKDGGAVAVIENYQVEVGQLNVEIAKYKNFLYGKFNQGDYDTFVDPYLDRDELEKIPGAYGELARTEQKWKDAVQEYNDYRYQDYDPSDDEVIGAEDAINDLKDKLSTVQVERATYYRRLYETYDHGDYSTHIESGDRGGAYGKLYEVSVDRDNLSKKLYTTFDQNEYNELKEGTLTTSNGAYGKILDLENQLAAEKARSQKLYDKLAATVTKLQNI